MQAEHPCDTLVWGGAVKAGLILTTGADLLSTLARAAITGSAAYEKSSVAHGKA